MSPIYNQLKLGKKVAMIFLLAVVTANVVFATSFSAADLSKDSLAATFSIFADNSTDEPLIIQGDEALASVENTAENIFARGAGVDCSSFNSSITGATRCGNNDTPSNPDDDFFFIKIRANQDFYVKLNGNIIFIGGGNKLNEVPRGFKIRAGAVTLYVTNVAGTCSRKIIAYPTKSCSNSVCMGNPIPGMAIRDIEDPVCGCNGVTYANADVAKSKGVKTWVAGTCEEQNKNNCYGTPQPNAICPAIDSPVCGCDGKTYANDCVAKAAGILKYTNGACAPTPTCESFKKSITYVTTCNDNGTPKNASDDWYYVDIKADKAWAIMGSNRYTSKMNGYANEFTRVTARFAVSKGVLTFNIVQLEAPECQYTLTIPAPASCSVGDVNTVCSQFAASVKGSTRCSDNGTPSNPNDDIFYVKISANADWSANIAGTTYYGLANQLQEIPTKFAVTNGSASFDVMRINSPKCSKRVVAIAPKSCSNVLDECMGTPNPNQPIRTIEDPVCGCNGKTYVNSDAAKAAGVKTWVAGACANTNECMGEATPNALCTKEYAPVCGCNGVTYSNTCMAKASGVKTWTSGACQVGTTTVKGNVFLDKNCDGLKDDASVGVSGVKVILTATSGIVRNVLTDVTGNYSFTALPNDTYQVCFIYDKGKYIITKKDATGATGTITNDSDINPATACSSSFTVSKGNSVMVGDMGLCPITPSSLAIVENRNGNGIESELNNNFNLYPNPTSNYVMIDFNSLAGRKATVAVFNSIGALAKEVALDELGAETYRLDTTTFPSGYYVVRIAIEGQAPVSKKLIIEK